MDYWTPLSLVVEHQSWGRRPPAQERTMHEARCRVCRRCLTTARPTDKTDDYTLTFEPDVCDLCVVTLARAMRGIVELLRQSNGERRERVIDRLIHKLEGSGFEVGGAFSSRRRTA
jgi:hypothetical protein